MKEEITDTIGIVLKNDKNLDESVQKVFDSILEAREAVRQTIEDLLQQLASSFTAEEMNEFFLLPERLKLSFEKAKKACEVLSDLGWTYPKGLSLGEIVVLVDNCTKEEIDQYFYTFYTENDNEVLNSIFEEIQKDKNIEKWGKLVNECILAYRNGFYLIIIPSLISIIEGLISKIMIEPNSTNVVKACKTMIVKEDSIQKIAWMSIYKFIERLFKGQKFNGDRPEIINRHRILHGRDEPNWSIVDVIKLFTTIQSLLFALCEPSCDDRLK
jgi:hypothetical protein